jgi:flagellar biosynthetic protein FlhB
MAEQTGEKTEVPTPKRRREARERGQVARSADLTAAAVILGALLLLNWTGGGMMLALQESMRRAVGPRNLHDFSASGAITALIDIALPVLRSLVPMFGGLLLVAVVINLLQVGFLFSTKRLAPDIAGISPIKGVKKIFGGGRGAVGLLMNLLKLSLVTAAGYSAVHGRLGEIVSVQALDFGQIFVFGGGLVFDVGVRIAVILLVLAIIDYAWQRFRFERDLRMTKQEVKEELKSMEGDPLIKQRRRQIQLQRAMQRARQSVPGADVIVTNPTEFAVALKYDSATMHAPKVVAKGADLLAQRIREIAIEHGIPIVQRPPLARALYRLVDVGQEIPEQFYNAVAEILAFVYRVGGERRREQAPRTASVS